MAKALKRKSAKATRMKAAGPAGRNPAPKGRRKRAAPRLPRIPPPFTFPPRHRRLHGPDGHLDYIGYKPWLRDEFAFRCVYCLTRELWSDQGQYGFTIDHVKPKSVHDELTTKYDNLVYCCFRCNTLKSTRGRLPDPCKVSLAEHVKLDDGVFFGVTPKGKRMVQYLQLNHDVRLPLRRRALREYRERDTMEPKDLLDTFGYPKQLPDLTTYRPPGGNSRPSGVRLSHYARRNAGKLPLYY